MLLFLRFVAVCPIPTNNTIKIHCSGHKKAPFSKECIDTYVHINLKEEVCTAKRIHGRMREHKRIFLSNEKVQGCMDIPYIH